MKKYQIIVDSASDLKSDYLKDPNVGFRVVPLTINIGEEVFVDDDNLDVNKMLETLHKYKGKTSSACPAPESFSKFYLDAEQTFVVTITSKLSGTYNSAFLGAKEIEDNKNHKVHVVDSKLVSGTQIQLVDKLYELIKQGLPFEEIVKEIEEYKETKHLYFTLNKFDNLVENGRMSRFAALIAKTLIIRPICKGIDGEIKVVDKVFGAVNAIKKMASNIKKSITDFRDRVLIISKCKADEESNLLINCLQKEQCDFKEIRVQETRGLCSYYALEKGLIVCY